MYKCSLVCEKCWRTAVYEKRKGIKCRCGYEVKLDEGVEDLVVALNEFGITTLSSCEGKEEGFESGNFEHPWIVIAKDKENMERAQELVEIYNKEVGEREEKEWIIEERQCHFSVEIFLFPKRKDNIFRKEELFKDVQRFARYIENSSRELLKELS